MAGRLLSGCLRRVGRSSRTAFARRHEILRSSRSASGVSTDLSWAMLVTMKRPAPGDRQASWLMSWVTGSWKVQLPSKPEPQWRKGAGRHVRCEISAGGDRSGNGHLEEHEVPVIDRFRNEEGPVRHLAGRLGGPAGLRACYEAGPCGFGLRRLLASMGVACDV